MAARDRCRATPAAAPRVSGMNGVAGDARVAMERHGTVPAGRQPRAAAAPRGELASRTLAMPADTNPRGDIFGGWLMALMDSAGKMTATERADGRVVTVAVSGIVFLRPVQVGDTVCCYTPAETASGEPPLRSTWRSGCCVRAKASESR